MADNENYVIRVKRGTANEWAIYNPILGAGELGYDTTNKRLKVGDGLNVWSNVKFATGNSFDVARDAGFDGTLSEWLESLREGPANTLEVGNVQVGGTPTASIRGEAPNQIIDFTFPGPSDPIEYSPATPTKDGLMPKEDKATLDEATAYGKDFLKLEHSLSARTKLGLGTGATASGGFASDLTTGTDTTYKVWGSKTIADYVKDTVNNAKTVVNVKDFGAVGDGVTDDTAAIQSALNQGASLKKKVFFPSGEYFHAVALDIPAGSTLDFDTVTLRSTVNYECIKIDNPNINIVGRLKIKRPSTLNNPRVVRVASNNIYIEDISIEGDSPGTGTASGNEVALAIRNSNNVYIKQIKVVNFEYPVNIELSTLVNINSVTVDTYRRGIYVKSSKDVKIKEGRITGKSPGAAMLPGHNAILVESTDGHGSTSNLTVSNMVVKNSGEHGIRFGGQQKIRNVWFNNIYVEDAGACGIKVLGGTQASNNYHENFFFSNILVADCGATDAAMAGIMLQFVKNVTVNSFQTNAINTANSCAVGIEMQAAENVQIVNPIIKDTSIYGIFIGFVLNNVKNITISGGSIDVSTGIGLCIDYTNRVFEQVVSDNTRIDASSDNAKCVKIRMNSGTPTVNGCTLGFKSISPTTRLFDTSSDSLYTAWKSEIEAPFVDISFRNGSTWDEWSTGNRRIRKSNAWSIL